MALTFANFRQQLPDAILVRGRSYYDQGLVIELEYDEAEDSWAAQVTGTDVYDVAIERGPDGGLAGRCTCPYEGGEHCKHIAATLYAIAEAFPEAVGGRPFLSGRAQRPTKLDTLARALEQTPPDKLRALLLAWAGEERAMLSGLLVRLDAVGNKPQDYHALVKQALRAGRGEHGYIDYHGARRAGAQLTSLLAQAKRMAEERRTGPAVALNQAILDQTLAALENADDSDGEISGAAAEAIENLNDVAERLPPPERQELFDYALQQARKPIFTGFDMKWDMYALAARLIADSPARHQQLFAVLDSLIDASVTPSGRLTWGYGAQAAARIKLDIIRRTEGEAAAFDYLQSLAHLDDFRRELIRVSIARDNLAEATRLAQEGVALSEGTTYRGVTNAYLTLLLDIAQRRQDTAAIRDLARRLWLGTGETQYYTLLKKHTPRQEWPAVLEGLIRDNPFDRRVVAWILAQEGLWPQLLTLAQSSGIAIVEPHRRDLEAQFPHEMAAIYERAALKMLAGVSNRDTYRDAANLLLRLPALGHGDRARQVATALIQKHPQRRAMVEELRRVTGSPP